MTEILISFLLSLSRIAQKQIESLSDSYLTSEACDAGAGDQVPNLLYQLLTSKNTDSVQKSSALWNCVSNNLEMDVRSAQSLNGRRHTHPQRTQSAGGPVRELARPASASRMHPYHHAHLQHQPAAPSTSSCGSSLRKGPKSSGSSPSPSVSIDSGVIEEPLDLTREVFNAHHYPNSDYPSAEQHNLLKHILSHSSAGGRSTSGSSNLSSPPAWSQSPSPSTPIPSSSASSTSATSYVHLAKKNLYPVQSRINEWLKGIALTLNKASSEMSYRDPSFYAMSWSRLLVLLMAEHGFVFVTSPVVTSNEEKEADVNEEHYATSEQVEEFRALLRECALLGLDAYTYELLQLIVIHKGENCSNIKYQILSKM